MQRHWQTGFANKTLFWLPTDTKERWIENCKDSSIKQYFNSQGWDHDKAISYTFNQYGFRSRKFDCKEFFITLGCSFTVGTGLNQEQSWPEQLSKMLDLPVYNLGVYGCAFDTCVRLAMHWLTFLKPKFVAILKPPNDRIEVLDDVQGDIVSWSDNHCSTHKTWFSVQDNLDLHEQKNALALEKMCDSVNAPLYHVDRFIGHNDYARDMMHQGPQHHANLANKILEEIDF